MVGDAFGIANHLERDGVAVGSTSTPPILMRDTDRSRCQPALLVVADVVLRYRNGRASPTLA